MENILVVDGIGLANKGTIGFFKFNHPDGSGEKIASFRANRTWMDGEKIKLVHYKTVNNYKEFFDTHLKDKSLKSVVVPHEKSKCMTFKLSDDQEIVAEFFSKCVWIGDTSPPVEEMGSLSVTASSSTGVDKQELSNNASSSTKEEKKGDENQIVDGDKENDQDASQSVVNETIVEERNESLNREDTGEKTSPNKDKSADPDTQNQTNALPKAIEKRKTEDNKEEDIYDEGKIVKNKAGAIILRNGSVPSLLTFLHQGEHHVAWFDKDVVLVNGSVANENEYKTFVKTQKRPVKFDVIQRFSCPNTSRLMNGQNRLEKEYQGTKKVDWKVICLWEGRDTPDESSRRKIWEKEYPAERDKEKEKYYAFNKEKGEKRLKISETSSEKVPSELEMLNQLDLEFRSKKGLNSMNAEGNTPNSMESRILSRVNELIRRVMLCQTPRDAAGLVENDEDVQLAEFISRTLDFAVLNYKNIDLPPVQPAPQPDTIEPLKPVEEPLPPINYVDSSPTIFDRSLSNERQLNVPRKRLRSEETFHGSSSPDRSIFTGIPKKPLEKAPIKLHSLFDPIDFNQRQSTNGPMPEDFSRSPNYVFGKEDQMLPRRFPPASPKMQKQAPGIDYINSSQRQTENRSLPMRRDFSRSNNYAYSDRDQTLPRKFPPNGPKMGRQVSNTYSKSSNNYNRRGGFRN